MNAHRVYFCVEKIAISYKAKKRRTGSLLCGGMLAIFYFCGLYSGNQSWTYGISATWRALLIATVSAL